MRLMDDIAMNLNKAEDLLCRIPADPQELNATVAEIKKLVHPAIKTTTRLMIQAEAHRLVESDESGRKWGLEIKQSGC